MGVRDLDPSYAVWPSDERFVMETYLDAEFGELISTHELCRRAGVTYRMLDMWANMGFVVPVVHAQGSGTARGWRGYQVGEVVEIRELKCEQARLAGLVKRKAR